MRLSHKIGLAFAGVIAAAYILGGVNVWIMKHVIRDSSVLADNYVPYVLIGNKAERYSMNMAYELRGYLLSEEEVYWQELNDNLIQVKDSLRMTKEMAVDSPYFKDLAEQVGNSEKLLSEYEKLINDIHSLNEIIKTNRIRIDASAKEYTRHCIEFLHRQNEEMKKQIDSEFISAYEAELIEIRFKKIAIVFEIIELNNSINTANSMFHRVQDQQVIKDALASFETVDLKLKNLREITVTARENRNNVGKDVAFEDAEVESIRDIREIARQYQDAINDLVDNWTAISVLKQKCENTTDIFLKEAVAMSERGMAETKKVSQETQSSLRSAAIIMIIGLIVWGPVSAVLAVVMINNLVTKPINRLMQLVRQVAEGDLAESTTTVQSDMERTDEIGAMTVDMIQMTNRIRDVIKEIDLLIHSVMQGRLEFQGNEQRFPGAWRELIRGVNNVVNSFMGPFKMTARHIEQISVGNIPEKIVEEYRGDFNQIKNNLNRLIDATVLTTRIAEEIAGGDLSTDIKKRSEHDRMMKALARMLDRLKAIMNETNGMIHSVKQGHLDIRGNAEAFEGGWQELVSGVNHLITGLSIAVSEKAALNHEMELAKRIQTSLLPVLPEQFHPDFQIAATMLPADQVGGDYFDVAYDKAGNLWFAVGDVSGHGVTPGLIMMMAQTIHTTLITNIDCDARDVVIRINEILFKNVHDRLDENHFMTFNAIKHLGSGKFQHAGAHLSLIVYRRKTGACELIETKGTYLNLKKDISKGTKNSEFSMEPNDILVLYSDGLTEARNKEGDMLDLSGFIEIIEKYHHKDVASLKELIVEEVLQWCGNNRQDDMSLIIVKMNE